MAMSAALSGLTLASLNPLRCSGTPLPMNVLLAAKLIFVCLLFRGEVFGLPEPFLPLVHPLEHLSHPHVWAYLLRAITLIAGTLLLINRSVRRSAFSIGVAFLFALLANRGYYLNSRFFAACILILIGLYVTKHSIWLLCIQFTILYFGSALNKLFEPDWRTGQYFEYWMLGIIRSTPYEIVSSWFPPGSLSLFLSWTTIVLEFSFAAGVLIRRFRLPTIFLAVIYHTVSVLLAGTIFGIFFAVLLFSFLVIVDWPGPRSVRIVYDAQDPLPTWLKLMQRTDVNGLFDWIQAFSTHEAPLRLVYRGREFTGMRAITVLVLLNPLTYLVAAVAIHIPYWLSLRI